jgi:hypothetical protein
MEDKWREPEIIKQQGEEIERLVRHTFTFVRNSFHYMKNVFD